jgi:hypothetical protein
MGQGIRAIAVVVVAITIEDMELTPHHPPNSPAQEVDLIVRWGG